MTSTGMWKREGHDSCLAEIARLTAALAEAQRERDALKGEVERLTTVSGASPQMLREMNRYRNEREDWRTKAEKAGAERDAAVKRAEEAEAAATTNANQYRLAYDRLTASESRLTLAERVVEAAVALLEVVDEWAGTRRQLREFRAAVAEYRKAVGE